MGQEIRKPGPRDTSRGKIYEQQLEKSEKEIEIGVDPKFKACWINDQVSQKYLQEVDSGSWEITLISCQSSWHLLWAGRTSGRWVMKLLDGRSGSRNRYTIRPMSSVFLNGL